MCGAVSDREQAEPAYSAKTSKAFKDRTEDWSYRN